MYLDTGNKEKKGYSKYLDDDALGYLHNATKYLDSMSSSNSDRGSVIQNDKKFSQASTVQSTQNPNGFSSYLETSGDVERTPSGHKYKPHVAHSEKTPAKYKDQGYSNYLDKNSRVHRDPGASDRAPNGYKEVGPPAHADRDVPDDRNQGHANGYKENISTVHTDRDVSEHRGMGHGNGDVYSDRAPQGGRKDDVEEEDLKNRVSYLELENEELRERNEILSGQMAVIKVCMLICVHICSLCMHKKAT